MEFSAFGAQIVFSFNQSLHSFVSHSRGSLSPERAPCPGGHQPNVVVLDNEDEDLLV